MMFSNTVLYLNYTLLSFFLFLSTKKKTQIFNRITSLYQIKQENDLPKESNPC